MQRSLELLGEPGDPQPAGVLGQIEQLGAGQGLYLTQEERTVCGDHCVHHLGILRASWEQKTGGQTHSVGGRFLE